MRFTIRSALLGTVFAALLCAVVVLSISRSRLAAQINSLRALNGVLTDDREHDRIDMMCIGPGLPAGAGSQMFRVENHQQYELQVNFVCTTWPQSTTKQLLNLNQPQYAITYDEDHRQFFIQSTLGSLNSDHYRIDVPSPGKLVSLTPTDTRRPITDAPFLAVLFGDDPTIDRTFFDASSLRDFVDFCKNNHYNAVTFSLAPK